MTRFNLADGGTERQLSRKEMLSEIERWHRDASRKRPFWRVSRAEWMAVFMPLMGWYFFACGLMHTLQSLPNYSRAAYCIALACFFTIARPKG